MKGHKLIKELGTHFLIQHADGSAFPVAKKGNEAIHDKIRSLPVAKFVDGGDVKGDEGNDDEDSATPEDTDTTQTIPDTTQKIPDTTQKIPDTTQKIPDTAPSGYDALFNAMPAAAPKPTEPIAPEVSANQATDSELKALAGRLPKSSAAAPTPAVNPNTQMPEGKTPGGMQTVGYQPTASSAMGDISKQNEQIVSGEMDALKQSGQAAAAAAAQQQKVYADSVVKQKELQDKAAANYAALDAENNQLKSDVANTKVDPTRVWSSASTGNKIMAGIGIILGGIGAGLTGGKNEALDVINKTIDRDIDAQKAELGKKENLLSLNYRKYGDLHAATLATQAQLNSVTQGQIAAIAARSNSAQVQTNATLAMAQLQTQQLQLKQQLAISGLKSDILNGQAPPNISTAMAENLFPGRTVNTPQGVKIAKTTEDAKDASKALTSLQKIDSRLKDMLAFTKKEGTTAPFGMTAASATGQSLKAEVVQELGELNGLSRLTGEEADLREKHQVPDPGAWNGDKSIAQVMLLQKFVDDTRNAIYANHLSNFNPGKGTTRDIGTGAVLTSGTAGRP